MTPEEAGKLAYEMASKLRISVGQETESVSTITTTSISDEQSSIKRQPILHIDSILAHAGLATNDKNYTTTTNNNSMENIPMSPPLHLSTTYTRPPDGHYLSNDSIYIRADNPTRLLLESTMYQLETHGGIQEDSTYDFDVDATNTTVATDLSSINSSFAFASGMMAASAIILSHSTPLHVILPIDLYHGITSVLQNVFIRFNVTTSHIDMTVPDNQLVELLHNEISSRSITSTSNIGNTSVPVVNDIIVWIETPSNPLCHVIDIMKVCTIVSKYNNVTTVVDSTLAPPICCQPLKLGCDIVVHSATKYLGGHSDSLCGIVTVSSWTKRGILINKKIHQVQTNVGGVASTFDSWLILRGLRTLRQRFEQQCSSAMTIALFFTNNKQQNNNLFTLIKNVYYPGISNPNYTHQHIIATKQMSKSSSIDDNNTKTTLYGGVLSVEFYTEQQAYAFIGGLQLIHRATSLGGTETLIEHRYSIEPIGNQTSPVGLVRISVGLENTNDLIHDIQSSLTIVSKILNSSSTINTSKRKNNENI